MAHFARINPDDGMVCEVVVIDNAHLLGEDDLEHEELGTAYLESIGLDGTWVQTSYNSSFRGAFAGVGMTWNGTEFRARTNDQNDEQEAPSA